MSHAPARLTVLKPVHLALLALVSLVMFLPGFLTIPPFDRDESRYAQASHQMLETDDYVDIRYQEEARHKKPVGIYWMQAASVKLLSGGDTHGPIWMYRLPSLLGAIAAVLLTAWAGARLFGATVGVAAGLILASTVILGVEARMAKTDAVLLSTIVAAQAVLARIYLDGAKPQPTRLALVLIFWGALGLGILVKGPVILMPVGGTILALWVLDRQARWLRDLRPAIGIPVLLAVVLPWLVAIGLRTDGAFFSYAIGHEFLGKAHTGQENHGAPPGYYLLTFWLTFWPFSLLAVLALPWVWRNRADASVRFCIAWIVPTWVIFEAVVTKLPHYTSTVFPAVALLTVAAALDRFEGPARTGRPGFWAASGFFLVITLAFAGIIIAFPYQLTGEIQPFAVIGALVILGTGIAAVVLEHRREPNRLMAGLVAGAALTYGTVHGIVLPNLDPMWLSRTVHQAVQRHAPCPGTLLAASGYTEPSMVFLVGTKTKLGGPGLVGDHLAADPACALGLVEGRDEADFQAHAAAIGLTPVLLETMPGFNYSRGQEAVLRLYRAAPPDTPAPASPAPAPTAPVAPEPVADPSETP
ncbi:MAG: hypothetical protein RLY86_4004 [Pseudomonadota bacterium]|jgi:4-amino-4-deoxy-L-arabinose transferase-like glycosyltransferase